MYKKCVTLLLTGLLLTAVGCSNNMNNSEETIMESAVDNTTADSDDIETDSEEENETETGNKETNAGMVFGNENMTCILPGEFEQYEDEEGLYVNKNYPKDSASVSYIIAESETDITSISQEAYKAELEAGYLEDYGDVVTINISQYDTIQIDGRPCLKILMDYEFKGIEYEQLVYMIYNGDESHILNYTQEKGGKWMDQFIESGDSISFSE